MEIFALIVILVLVSAGIALFVVLGGLPAKLAREANHPQTGAITLLGWLGLLAGGIGWLIALVWARTTPGHSSALEARVAALEAQQPSAAATEGAGE